MMSQRLILEELPQVIKPTHHGYGYGSLYACSLDFLDTSTTPTWKSPDT